MHQPAISHFLGSGFGLQSAHLIDTRLNAINVYLRVWAEVSANEADSGCIKRQFVAPRTRATIKNVVVRSCWA